MSTLVCLIFPWIVFSLDILLYGDEQTCQRKNQVEQGEKFYLFIMASSSFPNTWKFMRKHTPFKIPLAIWHSSWGALILVIEYSWSGMFTYFASWPWASYLHSIYLNGVCSVNHRCRVLCCHWNQKGCICGSTLMCTPQNVWKVQIEQICLPNVN